jgi:hypothetical protein
MKPRSGGIVDPLRYAQPCTMGPLVVNVPRHRLALGLFLLRLVVAVGILSRDAGSNLVETGAAFLLLGGLWTSTVGAIITLIEVWGLVSGSGARGAAVCTGSSSMTSARGTTISTPSARSRRR